MFCMPLRYDNIREIPYPYKGIVALSNDAEYASAEFLDWLLMFLNTTEKTALGYGLGMEFATSVFFYSCTPLHASFFDSLSVHAKETKEAQRLRAYIKCGYIDTNHAFGDFNETENFTRNHALKVYEMLDKYALSIPIYTNHGNGNTKSMQHNIGFLPHHLASHAESPFYHTDLFRKNGGCYVWSDDYVYEKAAVVSLDGGLLRADDGRGMGEKFMQKLFCGDAEYFFFKRYRSTGVVAPTFQTFNYQIQSIDWEYFCHNCSVIIFYQHFGSFYVANKGNVPTTLELLRQFPYYLNGLYFLKEQQDKGNILVMSTSHLLKYVEMYMSTKVEHVAHKEKVMLKVHNYHERTIDFFDGLTIYIDNPKEYIEVSYLDKLLKFVYNGLDARGRYSITLDSKKGKI